MLLGDALEGEAAEIGAAHGRMAREALAADRPALFLSGGELTVTVRGNGEGGPNQEYALALALADRWRGWDHGACRRHRRDGRRQRRRQRPGGRLRGRLDPCHGPATMGLIAANFFSNNDDSGDSSNELGDLLLTGPTGTNVNDFRCVVVDKRNFGGQ